MILAVDGPAASGKGTIARALAVHYGLPHLDTGLLYRAAGIALLRAGGDPDREDEARRACVFDDALLADPALRGERAGALASQISAYPAVRAALLDRQRAFARQPGGAVLDGRDIGTVIAPDADMKLYVTATLDERTRRRHGELVRLGQPIDLARVRADIAARDARDGGRADAPLRQAADAHLLDTTDLTIGAAIQSAIALVDARLEAGLIG